MSFSSLLLFQPLISAPACRRRSAVTLMEVIFAIGVILTGLVGLAALIPIATDNATATLELDRSISESVSAAARANAQKLTDFDQLVLLDKSTVGSSLVVAGTAPVETGVFAPTETLITVSERLSSRIALNSPGYAHDPNPSDVLTSFCIDPLGISNLALDNQFVTSPLNREPWRNAVAADSSFDSSRFPYFSERTKF